MNGVEVLLQSLEGGGGRELKSGPGLVVNQKSKENIEKI